MVNSSKCVTYEALQRLCLVTPLVASSGGTRFNSAAELTFTDVFANMPSSHPFSGELGQSHIHD